MYNIAHLWLKHITQEEDHHTSIYFILCAPYIPSRYRLTQCAPNIIWRNNYQYKQHFNCQDDLWQIKIDARWIIIGTFNQYLRIFYAQNVDIFLKCLSIPAGIAEYMKNVRQNNQYVGAVRSSSWKLIWNILTNIRMSLLERPHFG